MIDQRKIGQRKSTIDILKTHRDNLSEAMTLEAYKEAHLKYIDILIDLENKKSKITQRLRNRPIELIVDLPEEVEHDELAGYIFDALASWGGGGGGDANSPLFNGLKTHSIKINNIIYTLPDEEKEEEHSSK